MNEIIVNRIVVGVCAALLVLLGMGMGTMVTYRHCLRVAGFQPDPSTPPVITNSSGTRKV